MIIKETLEDLQREARRYDLSSLLLLQNKRQGNVILFEDSIRNERLVSQQEEKAEAALMSKLRTHDLGLNKLDTIEYQMIVDDLPKLKSTRAKREQTIDLLKVAILEEQEMIDRESKMIRYLESINGSEK